MKNPMRAACLCVALCVFVLFVYIITAYTVRPDRGEAAIDPRMLYQVTGLVDGDTFRVRVRSRDITVRMLGVNTPETVDPRKPVECYGHEASAETASLLRGRSVRLVYSPDKEHRDKYGRYLLYVYRDDGLMVNEALLRGGFAREYTVGKPYSLEIEFKSLESSAQQARMGLWGACSPA